MNRRRNIGINDKRPPMLRFLTEGQLRPDADGNVMVVVNYDQQWRTLFKAQRLGYIDGSQHLTAEGRAFIAKAEGRS
jgi:hypothetical protein